MFITGGKFKKRKIKTPKGEVVRPSSGLIRESLFNMLQDDIYNTTFADLFAGSGAVGIEALSRGAAKTIFIEKESTNTRLIKTNIESLKTDCDYKIFSLPVEKSFRVLATEQPDIIFIDPPYELISEKYINELFNNLISQKVLKPDCFIILQYGSNYDFSQLKINNFNLTKNKKYGKSRLTFWHYSL